MNMLPSLYSTFFKTTQQIFRNASSYMNSVVCDPPLNLVNMDEHATFCRRFVLQIRCIMMRIEDAVTKRLRAFHSSKIQSILKSLIGKTLSLY